MESIDAVTSDPPPPTAAPTGLSSILVVSPEITRARDDVRRGLVREGMEQLAALPLRPRSTPPLDRAVVIAALVGCRLARGDLADAMTLGNGLSSLVEAGGAPAAVAHHAKGELADAAGDPELALAHFLVVGQLLPDIDPDVAPWRSSAALAQLRTGDPRGAAQLARRGVDTARLDARPTVLAHALRVLAAADVGGDRPRHLREARVLLPDGTADRLAAQIDTDLAGLLLLTPHTAADGSEQDALRLLRSAELPAARQELWPLQNRVRRLLAILGEVPRRLGGEALAVLTPAERRVTLLAVEGDSNRRIAGRLEVSVKAVEWHLVNVYRKLGVSTRGQLAETIGTST